MRLDIVIPAHNEEHRIDRMLTSYRSRIADPTTRFVVALDHCTDRTASIVGRHAEVDRRVEAVAYPKLGKGGVIMEAFRRSDADRVAFVDADCATPPAELLRLLDATETVEVAIASRWHPASVLPGRRPVRRRVASAAFAFFVRLLFGLPYKDTQCGAKVLRRDAADAVAPFLSSRDFLFDVDLLVHARALGLRVAEVPTVWVDQAGSRIDTARDARRMAISSLRLWLHTRVLPPPPPDPGSPAGGGAPAPESAVERPIGAAI
ncbi:MAG: glycosyltransferase [Acidimicrobiales bacterium]